MRVKAATEEFLLHDDSIFTEILSRLERDFPQEKELLLFIADGVNKITELSELCQTDAANALGHLIGYQLIVRKDMTYQIKMNLLLKWIRRCWLNLED